MFQRLWLLGVDWNDPLPKEIELEWLNYIESLKKLEIISIPRWIGLN